MRKALTLCQGKADLCLTTTVVNCNGNRKRCDVFYIMRPGPWGNPFVIGCDGTREEVIAKHRAWLLSQPELVERARKELKGKTLACCCKPLACHGDVLAEIANEPMANPILIDGNNLAMRSIMLAATDDLKAGETFTGGIWGTLSQLSSILTNPLLNAAEIFAFWDAGIPEFRKKLIPEYKAERKEKQSKLTPEQKEKAYGQLMPIRKMLGLLGVVCVSYKNREADDGVAAASQLLVQAGRSPIIVSSDKDLYQCVQWGAAQWDINKRVLVSEDNFTDATDGVELERWLLYRTLVGDTSDGIKGAPGCGPDRAKQAIALLEDTDPLGSVPGLASKLADKWPGECGEISAKAPKWAQGIWKDADRLGCEMAGIDLEASFGDPAVLAPVLTRRPLVQPWAFLRFCRGLNFKSVLSDPDRFIGPFKKAADRRFM